MATTQIPKLVIVLSHPIQYFAPLFRRLTTRGNVRPEAFYLSRHGIEARVDPGFAVSFQWDVPLLDGYSARFLANSRPDRGPGGFLSLLNWSLVAALRNARPDVVIVHGYQYASCILAVFAAKGFGARVLFRGESNLLAARSSLKSVIKRLVLTPYFKLFDGFLCIGTVNRAYYLHYGVPARKLFLAPYSVENERFQRQYFDALPSRDEIRAAWGIPPGRVVIGFAAKLMPVKQTAFLLEVIRRLAARHDVHVLFVGEGILRPKIEAEINRTRMQGRATITGFMNQLEISRAYAAMDIFTLPSSFEPWGLVVNEAMSFALPIFASDQAGSAYDLVRPSENGAVLPVLDVEAWEKALEPLIGNASLRQKYGERSLEIIGKWGLDETAAVIEATAKATLSRER